MFETKIMVPKIILYSFNSSQSHLTRPATAVTNQIQSIGLQNKTVQCIIIFLSFLNCDWLLIRESQLYWYQEFLCPVEPLYFSDEKSTLLVPRVPASSRTTVLLGWEVNPTGTRSPLSSRTTVKCTSQMRSQSQFIDGGVNLKVRGLTGTWGGCRHRNAKIWGKKGRFCKNLAKTGGLQPPPPPAPRLRRPCSWEMIKI